MRPRVVQPGGPLDRGPVQATPPEQRRVLRNTWKCVVWDHDVSFTSHGRTMVWECRRGCGTGGSKKYASSSQAAQFATAFDRRDRADLGRRAPLLGMFPVRLWYRIRRVRASAGGGDGHVG